MRADPAPAALPVALVGARGHGRWHLEVLDRLARAGEPVRLAGICDPAPLEHAWQVPVTTTLPELLDRVRPAVTIVCTPIHTHADIAVAAAKSGSDVLLEKPPAPTLADFDQLRADLAATGRSCQVGFQSLGSHALARVRRLLDAGAIGQVRGIGAFGAWQRDAAYYARAPWAGRRTLHGRPVVDGALTNPFAHAVATALALDGSGVRATRVELFRANPIDADDTSCLRMTAHSGTPIVVAGTLCADRVAEPRVLVHGSAGRIELHYRSGRVRVERGGAVEETEHGTTELVANLAAHVLDDEPLLVPLESTRSFTEVLEAVRLAPDPVLIPAQRCRPEGSGDQLRQVIPGITDVLARCAEELATLSELDFPGREW